ncbi:prolipoprotein diacylglyceryl transferase [Solemya pervernicosa gill symbiont]|uniref:Phosphatidylglycerol--prolipoprotein diacylglyceryl transferase n=2 Tax=Gammaproteobacteria incertae sedis TaxID=118884 RepID=A0A1T2L137_9GAMM|nr:prolipoprotein diacylglyceryl transferase [Candidatus Reidiella endopervernicosa]OOZ38784.1 prolipoprotein diacylglyceryl transferase [Solemya pervernicosa gill symbiont]QKQ25914.1 prolipoprotein diacylglyceryl transferase [Candidatus Reidiella endopervernicosa]
MLTYPNIDPVALALGPVKIHWYGLMYLIGFAAAWWLGRFRARKADSGWKVEQIDDLIFYAALGVILGGRIGYILFYNFANFIDNPLILIRIWEGGMSFHGGLLGVLVSMLLFGRKVEKGFFTITDFIAPLVPVGLMAGRIGNFINGELWGRVTDHSIGMVFPGGGPMPRHPSQLYEAALEGLILFLLLWWFSAKPRPRMAVSGLFLIGYGVARTVVEFAREPDDHLGFIAFDWLTMGQMLSLPMVMFGVVLLAFAYRRRA